MDMPSLDDFGEVEFEELCIMLLKAVGFVNGDWPKGASDLGHDLVFQRQLSDVDGHIYFETWFADCKHFNTGVPQEKALVLASWQGKPLLRRKWDSLSKFEQAAFVMAAWFVATELHVIVSLNPTVDFLREANTSLDNILASLVAAALLAILLRR